MLPKSVIACLAASAFATGALMPTGASAVKGGPMPGTWNWPPYAGSGGGMPGKPICSYVRVEPYRHKPGKGHGFTSVTRSRSDTCVGHVSGTGYRAEVRTASTRLTDLGRDAPGLVAGEQLRTVGWT
jgi:hypothetical protein